MKPFVLTSATLAICAASAALSETARADEAPAPYSLPWQLRPAAALTVVRSDTAFAFNEDPVTKRGTYAVVPTLLASFKVVRDFAPFVRLAMVATPDGGAVANPALGGTYVVHLGKQWRLGLFLGLTVPVGMGGGDQPNKSAAAAVKSGILARSAMDNALFAVNDFTVFPGIDIAFVSHGFTVQAEATVLALMRVRGENVQKDATKANFTAGLHVGYFFVPQLSVGTEIRYQRWLSTPALVAADLTGATRDNLTFAIGPRAHFKLGSVWFRPGVAYARGLDLPMAGADYNIVQVDLPFVF